MSFVITWLPREGGREPEVSAAFCLQLRVQVKGDFFLSLQGAKARLVSMPLVGSHSTEGGIALCCSTSPSIPTEHPSHSAVRGAAFRSHRVGAVLSFRRCLSNRLQHGHRFNSVFQPWYIDINSNGGSWALVIHWRHHAEFEDNRLLLYILVCKAWFCWSYWCWREHLLQSIYGIMSWPQTLFSQFEFDLPPLRKKCWQSKLQERLEARELGRIFW